MTKLELKKWLKELLDLKSIDKNFKTIGAKPYYVIWNDAEQIGGEYLDEKGIVDMYNEIIHRCIGDKYQVEIFDTKTLKPVYFYVSTIKKEIRRDK